MRNLRLVHSRASFAHSRSSTGLLTVREGVEPGERPSRLESPCGEIESAFPGLDPVVQSMLERVRIIAPLPRIVRARVFARARAAIAAPRF